MTRHPRGFSEKKVRVIRLYCSGIRFRQIIFWRLYLRIQQQFHFKLYCTDHWEAYRQVTP